MTFKTYHVTHIFEEVPNTYILRLQPAEGRIFPFLPGQFVYIKNPFFLPEESHPFSIASSPNEKTYLEFCIKVYGDWTKKITEIKKGSIFEISEPRGSFIWNKSIRHAVFLLGGIGISPIMSILRFLAENKQLVESITMLYGNRTPETIAYKDELVMLSTLLPLKIIHIFSHVIPSDSVQGHRGFITEEILKKEVNLECNPTFFVVGPPIFVEKMKGLLSDFTTPYTRIKEELLQERSHE